jgi:chromate transport protein ChrA
MNGNLILGLILGVIGVMCMIFVFMLLGPLSFPLIIIIIFAGIAGWVMESNRQKNIHNNKDDNNNNNF